MMTDFPAPAKEKLARHHVLAFYEFHDRREHSMKGYQASFDRLASAETIHPSFLLGVVQLLCA
jgi:hypothetical protein